MRAQQQLWMRGHDQPSKWFGCVLIVLALFAFCVVIQRQLQASDVVVVAAQWPDQAAGIAPPAASQSTPAPTHATSSGQLPLASGSDPIRVSAMLQRIYQLSADQYNSTYTYSDWAYSTCSAASMAEVINAYDKYYGVNNGRQYTIADILAVEQGTVHEITPELGLLEPTGIDKTVSHFGFYTRWLTGEPLSKLVAIAESGRPVIISFPPDRWSGGHILVLRGGNVSSVLLADSSRLDMTWMDKTTFNRYWEGFAVEVLPKGY